VSGRPAVRHTPGRPAGRENRPAPDFVALHSQLQKHKHLTLQLLWEEYRAQEPEGYGYSRFCELYGAANIGWPRKFWMKGSGFRESRTFLPFKLILKRCWPARCSIRENSHGPLNTLKTV
jgi:hypothetical protein